MPPHVQPLSVALIGHSMLDDVRKAAYQQSLYKDLGVSQLSVNWLDARGMTWRKYWRSVLPSIPLILPDIVYFQIVENDLDSPESVEHLAQAYLGQALVFVQDLCVEVVIISMAIHQTWTRTPGLSRGDLQDKVDSFNQLMRMRLLRNPGATTFIRNPATCFKDPHIWWWEHARLRACPPAKLAADGVHLTTAGTARLLRSVKTAVWQASAFIRH